METSSKYAVKINPDNLDIITVDCGSTSTKLKLHHYTRAAGISTAEDKIYSRDSRHTEYRIRDGKNEFNFKSITDANLVRMLALIDDRIAAVKNTLNHPPLLVVTGFTNSLAVRYTDGATKTIKNIILLDEPSLKSDFTPTQKDIYFKYLNTRDIKPKSTIMKLITLYNHPNIIRSIFGDTATFNDLTFGTMLGTVTEKLSGDVSEFGMPIDDIRGLGNNGLDMGTAYRMLVEMIYGSLTPVNEDRTRRILRIHPEHFVSSAKAIIMEVNDFTAETRLIRDRIDQDKTSPNQIPENSIILALDTVGKIIWNHPDPDSKQINGLGYDIQRTTGLIMTKWNKSAYSLADGGEPDYPGIDNILTGAVNSGAATDYVFFPDLNDDNEIGMLFSKKSDGSLIKIMPDEIGTMSEPEKKSIILATAQGIFFGLRRMITRRFPDLNEPRKRPVICYGGIGSNGQEGWNRLFAEIFFDISDVVGRLDLPSGNTAAAYTALKQFGWDLPAPDIKLKYLDQYRNPSHIKIRHDQYTDWLSTQDKAAEVQAK
jgi:hypothetical protein